MYKDIISYELSDGTSQEKLLEVAQKVPRSLRPIWAIIHMALNGSVVISRDRYLVKI